MLNSVDDDTATRATHINPASINNTETNRMAKYNFVIREDDCENCEKTEIEYVSKAALRADVVRSLFQIGIEQLIDKSAGELTIEAWDVAGRRIVAGNLSLKVQS
jgi:hypothetical protein